MEARRVRLGDVIDDYCPRCRLIMNHGVVGMVGDEVRKTRCNTCLSEHVYRRNRLPARRRNETDKLFREVLKGMGREAEETEAGPESTEPAESAAVGSEASEEPEAGEEPRAADPPAAVQPPAPSDDPRTDAPEHGVRRKLYTIRRHSGGKPPTGGRQGS